MVGPGGWRVGGCSGRRERRYGIGGGPVQLVDCTLGRDSSILRDWAIGGVRLLPIGDLDHNDHLA